MALGMLSVVLANSIWAILEIGLGQDPYPSIADILYFGFYPFFITGIMLLPAPSLRRGDMIKIALDTGVLMISAVLGAWAFLLKPLIEMNQGDLFSLALSVSYLVADLGLLFVGTRMLFMQMRSSMESPLTILAASAAVLIASDFAFAAQQIDGAYISGNLVDTGYVTGYCLIGLAGMLQAEIKRSGKSSSVSVPQREEAAWSAYMPCLGVIAAYIILVWSYYHPLSISFPNLVLGMGAIVGLMFMRQIITSRDNSSLYLSTLREVADKKRAEEEVRRLNEGLESRVAMRTLQLESANRELQKEIVVRKGAESALRRACEELESRVQERTGALSKANEILTKEIAERKAIEEQLVSEKAISDSIVENIPAGIAFMDRQFVVHGFNRIFGETAANYVRGLDPDKIMGRCFFDSFPSLNPQVEDWFNKVLDSGVAETHYDFRLLIPGEPQYQVTYWNASVVPVKGSESKPEGILLLIQDVTERNKTEIALSGSEERYRSLIEQASEGIFLADADGFYTDVNTAACEMLGFSRDELLGKNLIEIVPPDEDEQRPLEFNALRSNRVCRMNSYLKRKDGTLIPVEISAKMIGDDKFLAIVRDMTEQKRYEDAILSSLREKEILLKEVHHRVKNNLQVISSLLSLQARSTEEDRMVEVLRESQNRVKSMALVHEKLYRSGDLENVDLSGYIRSLVDFLRKSYHSGMGAVSFRLDLDKAIIGIDKAIPCGLIINELVSNCLKYAFPSGRPGEVSICLKSDKDMITLTVEDNGVGMPADLNGPAAKSLGLSLVFNLVKQIKGHMAIDHSSGTKFKITFAPGSCSNALPVSESDSSNLQLNSNLQLTLNSNSQLSSNSQLNSNPELKLNSKQDLSSRPEAQALNSGLRHSGL